MTMSKYLSCFNSNYYSYPTSICRGYWSKYPIENGLSSSELENRKKWIKYFEKSDFHKKINSALNDIFSNYEIDNKLLEKHGVFFEKFYKLNIKSSIVKEIISTDENFVKIKAVVDSNKDYSHLSKNKHDIIWLVIDCIYEYQLYALIHNKEKLFILEEWYKKYSLKKQCVICGNNYKIIDVPNWLYFSSNGNKSCCFQCEIVKKPLKKKLFEIIPTFVKACGFIPKTNTHPLEYSFSSRFTQEKWIKITKLYGEMGGVDHVKKKFGSWFKSMVDTKAVPNGVKMTTRGLWCISSDGHQCHSIDEQTIDNWLHSNKIKHSREPLYPQHDLLNFHGKRRADWKVGDTFIEYFGLVGNKDYDKKTHEKIMLASINHIPLIELYPNDIALLKEKLGALKN